MPGGRVNSGGGKSVLLRLQVIDDPREASSFEEKDQTCPDTGWLPEAGDFFRHPPRVLKLLWLLRVDRYLSSLLPASQAAKWRYSLPLPGLRLELVMNRQWVDRGGNALSSKLLLRYKAFL